MVDFATNLKGAGTKYPEVEALCRMKAKMGSDIRASEDQKVPDKIFLEWDVAHLEYHQTFLCYKLFNYNGYIN